MYVLIAKPLDVFRTCQHSDSHEFVPGIKSTKIMNNLVLDQRPTRLLFV
jgi:hypothetical protein